MSKRLNWKHFKSHVTGISTLLIFYITYLLLIMLLPHTRPHYLPVEDYIVLHIVLHFALSPFISTFLRRIYANLLKLVYYFDYFTLVTDSN
jgi:hypothetical protein